MDALFGLPRKKSAGVSHHDPLLGNLFFYNQSCVDQFVSEKKTVPSSAASVVSLSIYLLQLFMAYFPIGMQ